MASGTPGGGTECQRRLISRGEANLTCHAYRIRHFRSTKLHDRFFFRLESPDFPRVLSVPRKTSRPPLPLGKLDFTLVPCQVPITQLKRANLSIASCVNYLRENDTAPARTRLVVIASKTARYQLSGADFHVEGEKKKEIVQGKRLSDQVTPPSCDDVSRRGFEISRRLHNIAG